MKFIHEGMLNIMISSSLLKLKNSLKKEGVDVDFSFEIKKIDFDIVDKKIEEIAKQKEAEKQCENEGCLNTDSVKIFAEVDDKEEKNE